MYIENSRESPNLKSSIIHMLREEKIESYARLS